MTKVQQIIWIPANVFAKIIEEKTKEAPEEAVNKYIVMLLNKYIENKEKIQQLEEMRKIIEEKNKEIEELKKLIEADRTKKSEFKEMMEIVGIIKNAIEKLSIDEDLKKQLKEEIAKELFKR